MNLALVFAVIVLILYLTYKSWIDAVRKLPAGGAQQDSNHLLFARIGRCRLPGLRRAVPSAPLDEPCYSVMAPSSHTPAKGRTGLSRSSRW